MQVILLYSRSQILEVWHISNDILAILMLRFCRAFCSRDLRIYLVLTAFACRQISVQATTKFSVFFFISTDEKMVH